MTDPPDLWAKARERLPDDVREWLSGLDSGAQQSPIDAQWIDSLISQAEEKQEELEKNRHSFSLGAGKHKLELRPLFENMIKWIDKFKGIGDVVSSFDPVHAALPWAAFRFVLQHLVAEQEHSDKFVKLLASMPRLLFTGRIFELVYTKKSMHLEDTKDEIHMGLRSLENLHRELVDLYAGLLSALQFCHSFFTKNKAMRKVAAVFNSSKPGGILGQLEKQHKKTYLTSKVIDTVVASINESAKCNEAMAFFYCKRDEENRRKPRDILQSILRQLSSDIISDKCKIHPRLRGLPDELERKGKTFDFFTCKDLIREIIEDYSRTFIILDALDECDRESREELMTACDELIQGNANIRVFLSSRTDDDIRRHFQFRPVIEIQTKDNEDDISRFVEDKLSRDRRWGNLKPRLRREIKQVFREKSQGMFQWAALQIQQLNRLSVWSRSNISEHLEIAPKGLEAAYDVVWEQIQDMPRGQACMAQRAFLWVLCAFEPLHTAELSLAMQLGPKATRPDTALDKENILDICGNLLTCVYDEREKIYLWHFCHLSAREYVENRNQYDIVSAHSHVAIASLKFLMGNTVWSLPRPPSEAVQRRRPTVYMTRSGQLRPKHGMHVRQRQYILHRALNHAQCVDSPGAGGTELGDLLKQFLGSTEKGSSTYSKWQKACHDEICAGDYGWISPRLHSRPLETMATFGLFYMLEEWWQKVVENSEIYRTESPSILSLAIKHGHEPIRMFLTEEQAGN
ncbi:vegetatible incompatibility protein HET-E-1 [Colletotrichum asianum]